VKARRKRLLDFLFCCSSNGCCLPHRLCFVGLHAALPVWYWEALKMACNSPLSFFLLYPSTSVATYRYQLHGLYSATLDSVYRIFGKMSFKPSQFCSVHDRIFSGRQGAKSCARSMNGGWSFPGGRCKVLDVVVLERQLDALLIWSVTELGVGFKQCGWEGGQPSILFAVK
jgi:hypothetical protein